MAETSVNNHLGRAHLKRLLVPWAAATLASLVLSRIVTGFADFEHYWAFYLEKAVLFGSIAALVGRAIVETRVRSRRFWILLSIAHSFYWATYMLDFGFDWDRMSARRLITEDILHLLYYAVVLLALIDNPHLPDETRPTSARRWIEVSAGAVFLIAVLTYVIGVPMALSPAEVMSYGPTMTLYTLLDTVVGVYLLLMARDCLSTKWRTVYLLLATDSLMWAGLDAYESMLFFNVVSYEPGGALDIVWMLPYVALLAAIATPTGARGRERTGEGGSTLHQPTTIPQGWLIIVCLVALPLMHFSLYALGLSDPSHRSYRELLVLVFGTVLGALAILDNRVRDRERGRVLRRLRDAHKQEDLGRLAGYVAHDLKNVMTVVNGYADLLLEEDGTDDWMRTRIRKIHEAGRSASHLSKQLLMFSRQMPSFPEIIDLNALVSEVSAVLERVIGENVKLTVQTHPGLWGVYADRSQIEHVLMNVVVNARDAMPAGGSLVIETRNAPASSDPAGGKDRVVLTVTDTGHGMDDETRSHAADPFFTTKEPGEGPGLGLSVALGIVSSHGGEMRIRSVRDEGATVSVYLPRVRDDVGLGAG